jgi:hypothetical protein
VLSTEFKDDTNDMVMAQTGQEVSKTAGQSMRRIAAMGAALGLSACGSFHSSGSGLVVASTGSHIASSAARASSSTGSLAPHTGKSSAGLPWQRHSPDTPAMVVRGLHHDTASVQQMLKDQEDVFISYKGWRRLGNGSLSLSFENERGKRLRCHESGGRVFVEAPAHDFSDESRPGSMVFAVFHHRAEDLFDIRRTADRRTGREFQQRQTVPVPKPYQYR